MSLNSASALGSKRQSQRFAVFGEIYSVNIGDGVIFECLKWALERRGVEVQACDISLRQGHQAVSSRVSEQRVGTARRVARYFVRKSISLRRLITVAKWFGRERSAFMRAYDEKIREADVVVIGGGQLIVERLLGFALRIDAIVSLAQKHEKKIVIYSCGGDRKQGIFARSIYRRMARAATFISVRDSVSREFLLDLDPDLQVHVHPDVGFLVSSVYPANHAAPTKVVGVNVMPHATFAVFGQAGANSTPEEHNASFVALVRKALDAGCSVRLMTNGDPLDFEAAKTIHDMVSQDDRVLLLPPPQNPIELARQVQNVTTLVCSRMHAGVVAYSYSRQVVPIVWDRKVADTWAAADPTVVSVGALSELKEVDLDASSVNENRVIYMVSDVKKRVEQGIDKMFEVVFAAS